MTGPAKTGGDTAARSHPVVLVVYEARVIGGIPEAGAEMSELGVFPPNELPSMVFSHDQEIVADWQILVARP